jgi:predicted nucleic acid-binding protein
MRIFLDANVLFSAAKSDGAVRALVRLLRARRHELCVDAYVTEEARRNIALKHPEAGHALLELLSSLTALPFARFAPLPGGVRLAEKDRPVLAAALHHRCDVLITGDKTHFGQLYGSTIEGVRILSPAQAAAALLD